jgi:hypothetical protein
LNKNCQPQLREKSQTIKFVAVVADPDSRNTGLAPSSIPFTISSAQDALYRDHFFRFLERYQLTREFCGLAADLLCLMRCSGPLLNICHAIGALEAGRRGSVQNYGRHTDPAQAAFLLYGGSIRAFSGQIGSPGFQPDEGALWTTFLLGMFEV